LRSARAHQLRFKDLTGRSKVIALNRGNPEPSANRLLGMLSVADLERLIPALTTVSLEAGLVLNQPGEEPENIYFPQTGMISLLAVMTDGKAVETATVGREGVVGAMAGLGVHLPLTRSVVQVQLVASRIAAAPFRRAVHASAALRDMIVSYNDVLLGQVQITAACNALHPIQKRLARWILQTRDRIDTDTVPLTQELISEMLGVRRSSVSEIAKRLQTAGLIRYRRGSIEIVDRTALEAASCECYGLISGKLIPKWQ
jgi:CRP-like cAMP-binding protein